MGRKDLLSLKKTALSSLSDPVDISTMEIEKNKPRLERAADFFQFVRNPYFFRVGDIRVKVNFKGGKAFSEALVNAVNSA